jgi:lysophospholipase L1-like esterase
MLGTRELRPRPGHQRHGRPIHRHVLIGLVALALAGCGDSGDPATTAAVGQPEDGGVTLVAALGDSIVAGSPLWDPDPAVRDRIGAALDERSQFEYWASEADPSLEFRNCGVFGERTDEIAARLEGCSQGAEALLVQGGINDIAQGAPVEVAAENLDGIVAAGQERGLDVVIAEVLPWNNGYPAADDPINELNDRIAEIGAERNVPVLPFYETLEDPAHPGTMRAEWTDDGDHPSVAGYRELAERAVIPQLAAASSSPEP